MEYVELKTRKYGDEWMENEFEKMKMKKTEI
jgi:hypothetical protein